MAGERNGAAPVHRTGADGVRLSYRRAGDGEPVVLVHDFPETLQAAALRLVERHLRHFAVEFANWMRIAWREERAAGASS